MSPITELIGGAKAYGWGSFSQSLDFKLLAATVLNSNTTTVSFSNISQDYSHLILMGGTRVNVNNTNGGWEFRYNSSTSSTGNDVRQQFYKIVGTSTYGDSAGGASTVAYVSGAGNSNPSGVFGYFRIFIPTYKQTDKYRGIWMHSGYDGNTVSSGSLDDANNRQTVNQIPSTNALTSIECYNVNNFLSGSHFALYGVI